MATTPVFLPGEFHRERSLAGYSAWGHRRRTRLTDSTTTTTDVKSPDSFYCATELRNQDLVAMSAPLRLEQHDIQALSVEKTKHQFFPSMQTHLYLLLYQFVYIIKNTNLFLFLCNSITQSLSQPSPFIGKFSPNKQKKNLVHNIQTYIIDSNICIKSFQNCQNIPV